MTEHERILQEIADCLNEIERLISAKNELDIKVESRRKSLQKVSDEVATVQSSLIREQRKMQELDLIKEWLTPKEEVVNERIN